MLGMTHLQMNCGGILIGLLRVGEMPFWMVQLIKEK
jgi:hypothetical protein